MPRTLVSGFNKCDHILNTNSKDLQLSAHRWQSPWVQDSILLTDFSNGFTDELLYAWGNFSPTRCQYEEFKPFTLTGPPKSIVCYIRKHKFWKDLHWNKAQVQKNDLSSRFCCLLLTGQHFIHQVWASPIPYRSYVVLVKQLPGLFRPL